jgi:hypothetical protein
MRTSIYALGSTLVLAVPGALALYACGGNGNGYGDDGGGDDGQTGDGTMGGDGQCFTCGDGGNGDAIVMKPFMDAGFTAPDCPGCMFPPLKAPACSGAPTIHVVYPNDGVLVPPNMNVISVHWTPFGTPFTEFEVDMENAITDMRVITKCAMQTMDTEQPNQASGGCELVLDQNMWTFVANQNRGGDAVVVTVRGTTDGMCASTSDNVVNLSFANDDMVGAIYYWKSTVTANGTGGQIWVKSFGDPAPEQLVTTQLNSTCNGCHALSRDGLRMVINLDDDDSDDEYSDIQAALIDMTTGQLAGGGGLGPMFASFYPDHSRFIGSNGLGDQNPPSNVFYLYDGNAGAMQSTVTVGGDEPTMPDWGPDGKSVVFVNPSSHASWTGTYGDPRSDDDHIFGGSLMLMPWANGAFGAPTTLLQSAGENNYYPGYSPDGQLIVFDRAPLQGSPSGCSGGFCPNDSFSNPNARIMLMKPMQGAMVIDAERANGSPAAQPQPWSNSWPKWSPFLQKDHGDKLLWIAFSSTRDYGLRVRNHQPGMYQCYPADSYEDPGAIHGQQFSPKCQQPQLWMAAIDVSTAEIMPKDPSYPAFWLPFQDITTHNHTPQWTQKTAQQDAGGCVMMNDSCMNGGTCCTGLVCNVNGVCEPLPQ